MVSGTGAAAGRRKTTRARLKHAAVSAETPVAAAAAGSESADAAPALSVPATEQPVAAGPVAEQEQIARLAYSYWEARGCQGGSAEEDWLRAEIEIRSMPTAV